MKFLCNISKLKIKSRNIWATGTLRKFYLGQVALRFWFGQESRGVDNDVGKVNSRVPVNGMASQSPGMRLEKIHPGWQQVK
jgi:hypothetical protein